MGLVEQINDCLRGSTYVLLLIVSIGSVTVTSAQTTTESIHFAVGKSSAVKNGSVKGYATRDYAVEAVQGQTMSIKLTSKNRFLNFNILDKETLEALQTDPRPVEVTTWTGIVPHNGTYIIRVYLVRAEARRNHVAPFSLSVSITSPLPGESEAVKFLCGFGQDVVASFIRADTPKARVRMGDKSWMLPLVPAGSGSKYMSGNVILWTNGEEATFQAPGVNTACMATDSTLSNQENLEGHAWKLVAMAHKTPSRDVPENVSITVTFKDGKVSGKGVCNTYFAGYNVSQTHYLAISEVGATRMMCPHDSSLESAFFESLSRTIKFAINGDSLLLSTSAGTLKFVKSM